MLKFEAPVMLQLQPGRLIRWRRAAGTRLCVSSGRVWVTQAHDPDDHFLEAGQSMLLRPHARVLIGAERDATQIVFEDAPRHGA